MESKQTTTLGELISVLQDIELECGAWAACYIGNTNEPVTDVFLDSLGRVILESEHL